MVIAMLLFSCSSTTAPGLSEEIELVFGQTEQINGENIAVKFVAVNEDSRCPLETECFWAGNAEIVLQIFSHLQSINTTVEPKEIDYNGYNVKLISVLPIPGIDRQIPDEDYVIRLVISK